MPSVLHGVGSNSDANSPPQHTAACNQSVLVTLGNKRLGQLQTGSSEKTRTATLASLF